MNNISNDIVRSRFSSAPWYSEESENIIIGGVGGIGSWVTFYLSRIGHKLFIYDDDLVEETNLAGQFYDKASVGMPKVDCVTKLCSSMTSLKNPIVSNNCLYTSESLITPITFSCFDSIEARRTMFESWCKLGDDAEIFIDGRMEAETGQIYLVTKDKKEQYRETLFAEGEGSKLACSFKATTHNGAMLASLMVSGLNNYITNKKLGAEIRDVPFKTHYALDLFYFNAE